MSVDLLPPHLREQGDKLNRQSMKFLLTTLATAGSAMVLLKFAEVTGSNLYEIGSYAIGLVGGGLSFLQLYLAKRQSDIFTPKYMQHEEKAKKEAEEKAQAQIVRVHSL